MSLDSFFPEMSLKLHHIDLKGGSGILFLHSFWCEFHKHLAWFKWKFWLGSWNVASHMSNDFGYL